MGILSSAYDYARANGISPYTAQLASTIQGEAHDPAGQFAVASVMQNRVYAGIDTPDRLTSVGSFQANNHWTTPSPFALQQAEALQNGQLSDYGNTGNATYYNQKGYNSAYDAGGVNIGGNMYSDRYNQQPSTSFEAPRYDPAAANSSQTLADQQQDAQQDGLYPDTDFQQNTFTQNNGAGFAGNIGGGGNTPTFTQLGQDAFNPQSTFPGAGSAGGGPGGFASIGSGNPFGAPGTDPYTGANGAGFAGDIGSNTQGGGGAQGGGGTVNPDGSIQLDPVTVDKNAPIGSGDVGTENFSNDGVEYADPGTSLPSGSADSSQGVDAGMDVPSAIDGLAAVIAQATNSANKTAISAADTAAKASANSDKTFQALGNQLTKQIQQTTTQQTSTAQDIRTSLQSFTTNIFIRGAIIALGLIFVAIALSFFKPVQETVIKPVAKGARGLAETMA